MLAIVGFTMFSCGDGTTPAHTHTAGVAATCTTPQTCTTCDVVLQAATGHDFKHEDWVPDAEEATCTEPSKDIKNCGNASCTEKDRRTGSHPTLGHNLLGAYAATCTATGSTGTGLCDRCKQNFNGDPIPINGEAHDFSGEPVITPAACEIAGKEVITCGNAGCTEKHETKLDAFGHDWEWEENKIPETCLHSSKDTATCTNTPCTETNERNGSKPALGHTTPQSKPATCTSTGLTGTGHCERCNEDLTGETIPIVSDNHNFGNWTQKTAATCVSPEIQIRVCSYNPSHTDEQDHGEINSTAHEWGDWRMLTPATCVVKEKQERICSLNHSHYGTQDFGEINPSAHDWNDWTSNAIAASCVQMSKDTATCKNSPCTVINERNGSNPALGHYDWIWSTYNSTNGHVSCTRSGCDGGLAAIGDTGPAGGIIFYIAPSGLTIQGYSGASGSFDEYTAYYLEAAPANETSSPWGAYGTSIAGVTTFTSVGQNNTLTIGVGRKDTQTIVNSTAFTSLTDTAAQRCVTKNFGGKTDWFLPSLGELNEMYKARVAGVTGIPTTGFFWSSSQCNLNYAWYQNFASGNQDLDNKASNIDVRAIRAF